MSLTTGTKLGPYEILSPLGGGGMGEVYRARDTRLGRDVAIKVLPERYARDPQFQQRFEREARAVSSLQHSHICVLHDIGHDEAAGEFLVMEFLDGETVAARLKRGKLPLPELLKIGMEIADALDKAHRKGVVHRDLKPANIMLTKSGAKLMDFGLAKPVGGTGASPVSSGGHGQDARATNAGAAPLLSAAMTADGPSPASPITSAGSIIGTIQYMSPEQIEGNEADARSDIFALGATLYEMATGVRAFEGRSQISVASAILEKDPEPISKTQPLAPAALDRVVAQCLAKNPDDRIQSAHDVGVNLKWISESPVGAGLVPALTGADEGRPQGSTLRALPWAAAALGALALAAAVWQVSRQSPAKAQPKFTRLTYQQGYLSNARFAKDGQTVVYSAQWNNDPLQVFTVRTEFPQSTKVDLPSAGLLALSPTGDMEVAVDPVIESWFLSGTMGQSPMSGGTPRAQEKEVIAADFAPDGKTLAVARRANRKIQLEYPEGKVIYTTAGYVDYVRISPSGKEVAFVEHPVYGDDRGWVASVDENGNHKQLTQEFATIQGLAWWRGGTEIWFTAADETTARRLLGVSLSGKQRPILTTPQETRLLDIAADGRVLLDVERQQGEIADVDPASGQERRGLEWFDASLMGDILPDGKAIVYLEWGGPAGPLYLVVYRKLDGSAPVALGPGANPKFSPDGTLAASPLLTSPPQVILNPIGTGESRRLSAGEITSLKTVSWFPDGQHLLLTGAAEGQAMRTYEMDLNGGKPQPLGPADFIGAAVAGDGKRIAGGSASGEAVVFDRDTQKIQGIPGIEPGEILSKWTEDGQALIVYSSTSREARVYRVEAATGKRTLLQTVDPHDKTGSISPIRVAYAERSKTYVYGTVRVLGTLYVAEGLQ